jgi:hypothetical protein
LAVQYIAARAGGRFHLSPPTTEVAESSFGISAPLNNVTAIFGYPVYALYSCNTPLAATSELTEIAHALCRDLGKNTNSKIEKNKNFYNAAAFWMRNGEIKKPLC